MKKDIVIRNAVQADLVFVASLEKQVFGNEGLEPLPIDHFVACLGANPHSFFVAEKNSSLIGYTYACSIHFDSKKPFQEQGFGDFDQAVKQCEIAGSEGNCYLGINICSASSGAGKMLVEALLSLAQSSGKQMLGMARISGVRQYVDMCSACGIIGMDQLQEFRHAIVLSYVLQCAHLVGGAIDLLPWCPGISVSVPNGLPSVEVPDPVLGKYLRHPGLAVCGLLTEFVDDPASLNYSVLISTT